MVELRSEGYRTSVRLLSVFASDPQPECLVCVVGRHCLRCEDTSKLGAEAGDPLDTVDAGQRGRRGCIDVCIEAGEIRSDLVAECQNWCVYGYTALKYAIWHENSPYLFAEVYISEKM